MNDNPSMTISIAGHTDDVGDETSNLNLSAGRAQSVLNYLSSKGVSVVRLKSAGYGESTPVADNSTVEGKAMNRRVEFTIVSK
jgi:outer membrane protein OmpA-like peptidoglycan-associated protein